MPEDEFALIARCFAPLADDEIARGLRDDAALFGDLVLTTDAIVEGRHFLPNDPIDTIAQKALRVNLSDIAAKGARPLGYLLTLAWPAARPAAQVAGFAEGLARDQARFGLKLWGGDTTATDGPLLVSVTMFGKANLRTPDRRAARPGEGLWISGRIGRGALGLEAAQGGLLDLTKEERATLLDHYRAPTPRLDLSGTVAAVASAAMDVSDGLLADAEKIASASGVALSIDLECVPFASRVALAEAEMLRLAAGGDDYEILLTAAPDHAAALSAAGFTRIGAVEAGEGLTITRGGRLVAAPVRGFAHVLGV